MDHRTREQLQAVLRARAPGFKKRFKNPLGQYQVKTRPMLLAELERAVNGGVTFAAPAPPKNKKKWEVQLSSGRTENAREVARQLVRAGFWTSPRHGNPLVKKPARYAKRPQSIVPGGVVRDREHYLDADRVRRDLTNANLDVVAARTGRVKTSLPRPHVYVTRREARRF